MGTRSSLPSTCCLLCGLPIGSPDFPEIGFDGGRSGWLRSIFLPNLSDQLGDRPTYQRDGDQDASLAHPTPLLPNRAVTHWAGRLQENPEGLMDTLCSFSQSAPEKFRSFCPLINDIKPFYGTFPFMNHFASIFPIQSYLNSLMVRNVFSLKYSTCKQAQKAYYPRGPNVVHSPYFSNISVLWGSVLLCSHFT